MQTALISRLLRKQSGGGVTPEPTDGYTVTLNFDPDTFSRFSGYGSCGYSVNGEGGDNLSNHTSSPIVLFNVKTITFSFDTEYDGSFLIPSRGGTFAVGTTPAGSEIASLACDTNKEVTVTSDVTYYLSIGDSDLEIEIE